MTAAVSRSVSSPTTRIATWSRRSARLRTCLYSNEAATPVYSATLARVSSWGSCSSSSSRAAWVTAALDSPALGTVRAVQEGQHRLAGRLRCLGDGVMTAAIEQLDHSVVAAGSELLLDPASLGHRVRKVRVGGAHHDQRRAADLGQTRGGGIVPTSEHPAQRGQPARFAQGCSQIPAVLAEISRLGALVEAAVVGRPRRGDPADERGAHLHDQALDAAARLGTASPGA